MTLVYAGGMIKASNMPLAFYVMRMAQRNFIILMHNAAVIPLIWLFYRWDLGPAALLAIFGLGIVYVFTIGVSLLVSIVCARFRDIPPFIATLLQFLFLTSPIIWVPEQLHAGHLIVKLNPISYLMAVSRDPLIGRPVGGERLAKRYGGRAGGDVARNLLLCALPQARSLLGLRPNMSRIIADKLCLDFPIMTHASRSARNVAFKTVSRIGGRVLNENGDARLVRALDNIDLDLSAGDRVGLIGPNGSGKTTLIRTLAGIYHPSYGTLTVTGEHLPLFDINLGLDDEATGYENIFMRGLVMGMTRGEIEAKAESIAAYSELGSALDMSIRTYSAGMVLRLMFAIATSIEGDVILMDEWLAVGDRSFREKANQRLRELVSRTGILVIASHDMGLLRDICTLGLHLESGRVRNFGPIEEVIAAMEADDNVSRKGDEAA